MNLTEQLDRGSAAARASGARVAACRAVCPAAAALVQAGRARHRRDGRRHMARACMRARRAGRAVGRMGLGETGGTPWRAVAWFITRGGEERRGCGSSVGTTSPFLTWSHSSGLGLGSVVLVSRTCALRVAAGIPGPALPGWRRGPEGGGCPRDVGGGWPPAAGGGCPRAAGGRCLRVTGGVCPLAVRCGPRAVGCGVLGPRDAASSAGGRRVTSVFGGGGCHCTSVWR